MESEAGEKQLFKATCSECGEACEVPFEPTEGRPVKCRNCFKKRSGFGGERRGNNNFSRGRQQQGNFQKKLFDATCSKCRKECKVPFKPTEGKDVLCKDCYIANKE